MEQEAIDREGGWAVDEKPTSEGDSEFKGYIKLDKGDSIEGILKSKKENNEYKGKMVYYIESKEGDKIWGINGTVDLDEWMKPRQPGELIMIKRLPKDKDTGKGNPMQQYEVYHWETKEEEEA